MTIPTRAALRASAGLVDNFARAALVALDEIRHREQLADGWPARGDSAGIRSGVSSSPVERAVLAGRVNLVQLTRDRDRLAAIHTMIVELAHEGITLAHHYGPHLDAVDAARLRCIGGNGDDWWPSTRPGDRCDNFQSAGRDGLCDACYQARRRHATRTHGDAA